VDPLFVRYVAIGNSITAGFHGAGISDATQRASYPALIARQASARYEYASLGTGCPPPITSLAAVLTGAGTGACTVAGTPGRKLLNNVAVPGADSFDPTAPTPRGDPLTALILDGKNQVAKALEQPPSLVTIWIGSNDVLDAAIEGRVGPGLPTAKHVFAENYARMVNRLTEAGVENGILIGVADVTRIPLLIPASALQDPTFRSIVNAVAGETVAVNQNCAGSSVLVSLAIVAAIAMDAHPPLIACAPVGDPAVGDVFVLDAAEQSALTTAVTEYNTYISAKADSVGFVFVDPNPMWASARARGEIPAIPDMTSHTQPFGPLFSVDGVHPSNAGQVLIATMLLDAIEAEFGVRLPRPPG
jgi:lysophospholipase L1-like esterase